MKKSPIDKFIARIAGPRRSGRGYSCFCPSHDDRHRSLSLGSDERGNVLLFCHAGCSIEAILAALGMRHTDLFAGTKGARGQ